MSDLPAHFGVEVENAEEPEWEEEIEFDIRNAVVGGDDVSLSEHQVIFKKFFLNSNFSFTSFEMILTSLKVGIPDLTEFLLSNPGIGLDEKTRTCILQTFKLTSFRGRSTQSTVCDKHWINADVDLEGFYRGPSKDRQDELFINSKSTSKF